MCSFKSESECFEKEVEVPNTACRVGGVAGTPFAGQNTRESPLSNRHANSQASKLFGDLCIKSGMYALFEEFMVTFKIEIRTKWLKKYHQTGHFASLLFREQKQEQLFRRLPWIVKF